MPLPIIPIDTITRDAREAADVGMPVSACPYPDDWEAADLWRKAHHARDTELRELVTN